MPVKRRLAKLRRLDISPVAEAILYDLDLPPETPANGVEIYVHCYHRRPGELAVPSIGDLWLMHGEEIVAEWIEESPGARPACWWDWSSPRWAGRTGVGEPRQQQGGSAEPDHTSRHGSGWHYDWHHFVMGLPVRWRTEPTPEQPASFESQAAYLDRHGLLLPGEKRRISKAGWQPVTLTQAPSRHHRSAMPLDAP